MFETQMTLVGNAITAPQLRRTTESGQVVASFRVASTSRRWDRGNQEWVDGHSLRVRVTCWRRLAEGVIDSVKAGDPVIVVGRLYTRDWIDEQGNHRVVYELEATAAGHDLTRGTAQFQRHRAKLGTTAIEDGEAERRIGGEDSVPATDLLAAASAGTALDAASDDVGGLTARSAAGAHRAGDDDDGEVDDEVDEFETADKGHRVLVPA